MVKVHNLDGGLFVQEARLTKDEDLKAFASRTVKNVDRHIMALKEIRSKMSK